MSKDLDLKQRVLVGYYLEYQKEIPEMQAVNLETTDTDQRRFYFAVKKLENEGLITGAKFAIGGAVIPTSIMLTPYGIRYVEEVLEIKPTMSASEKVKEVSKKAASWGYNEIKDFAAKVLGEIISKTINS